MKKIHILAVSIISFISLSYADGHAATIAATSCSQAHVQTAVSAASSGDTVIVPAGNCSWSSGITIGKPVSIIGTGSLAGGTKLIAAGTMPNGFFNITGFTSNALARISGFYFEMTNWTPETAIKVSSVVAGNIRIDHNIFNQGQKPILFYNPKGLIDNNYFYNGMEAIEFSAGSIENANASWSLMAAGTAQALFIEDNHFIADANYTGTSSSEKIATFNGGKLVIRYNHFDFLNFPLSPGVTAYPIGMHGSAGAGAEISYWQAGKGARRGQSVVEIYNNVMEGIRIDFPVGARGGSNLIYNNAIRVDAGSCRFYLREEEYTESAWIPLRTEWPAEDQVHNTFIWNNTRNGVLMDASNIVVLPDETKIKLNRDYFLHEPQATGGREIFTGANGASNTYPTDGVTYPTFGTMIFTPDGPNAYYPYVSYTYPHPLRTGINPLSAPKGIRAIPPQ